MPSRYKSFHIFIWFVGLIFLFTEMQASNGITDFSILCQNQRKVGGNENVRLLVEVKQGVSTARKYKWIVSFRQGQKTILESSRYFTLQDSIQYYEFWYFLPTGAYAVVAELQPEDSGWPIVRNCPFICRNLLQTNSISDITLMDKDGLHPLMNRDIVAYMGILRFSSEMYTQEPGYYTIRAILYRQDENPYTEDAGKFTSVQQVSQSLFISRPQFSITESFRIDENESGNYLVEIFVYQDGQIISESNYPFYLVWSEIPEMIGNPEKYLPFMGWIHPVMGHDTFSISGDPLRQAFMQFWVRQNDIAEGYQYRAMERYFKQILKSIETFGPSGWSYPQAKYVSLLGWPDSVRSFKLGGDSLLYWQYDKPPHACYFIKPDGEDMYSELPFWDQLRLL